MKAVDGLRPGAAELVTAIDEHAQHDQLEVSLDSDQVRSAQRGQGNRVRVNGVGLAAVARGEHPHLRCQFRRHIQHCLVVVDQPVGDMPADAIAALHRPHPVTEPAPRCQHLGITKLIRPEFPVVTISPSSLITSIVAERLGGSIPIITGMQFSLPQRNDASKEGPSTSSRTNPFQPLLARCFGETHAMGATPMTPAGSRNVGATPPITSTKPGLAAVVPPVDKKPMSVRSSRLSLSRQRCRIAAARAA